MKLLLISVLAATLAALPKPEATVEAPTDGSMNATESAAGSLVMPHQPGHLWTEDDSAGNVLFHVDENCKITPAPGLSKEELRVLILSSVMALGGYEVKCMKANGEIVTWSAKDLLKK